MNHPLSHRRTVRGGVLLLSAAVAAAGACERKPSPSSTQPPPPPTPKVASADWREFEGSWNATGARKSLPIGHGRQSSIIDLHGTMLLTGEGRPGVGFRVDVIGLVDSETGFVGRGVWTDERGDEVFSELTGEGTKEANRIEGTIVGGTGRYAGVTGSFGFSWEYMIDSEDGSIQGRAVGLKGRFRQGSSAPEDAKP